MNFAKTSISELPSGAQESWQQQLLERVRGRSLSADDLVRHFDLAFRLLDEYPNAPVLLYAIGLLFRIQLPDAETGRILQSCLTQALLAEPGSAQKIFALLSVWRINGFTLNSKLIADTICRMIMRHQSWGATSDIAWALAFCLQERIALSKEAAEVLSRFNTDCVVLQGLHLRALGLMPKGFDIKRVHKLLRSVDLDGIHWLLGYETVRHQFLSISASSVKSHPIFGDLLTKKVSFYRVALPRYALVLHVGGAPEWMIRLWLTSVFGKTMAETAPLESEVVRLLRKDAGEIPEAMFKGAFSSDKVDKAREALLDFLTPALDIPAQSVVFN